MNKILPSTVGQLGVYVFIMFALVAIMFAQQYNWFDASKYLAKK